jgi:hypothetical protein
MREQTPKTPEIYAATPHAPDLVDQELIKWFIGRGGSWSGTATELLARLKDAANVWDETFPPTASLLCDHLEAHAGNLRMLGVEAKVKQGVPRTVSLRACPGSMSGREAQTDKVQKSEKIYDEPPAVAPELRTYAVAPEQINDSSAAKPPGLAAGLDSAPSDPETPRELAAAMREITQLAKRVHQYIGGPDSPSSVPVRDSPKQAATDEFRGTQGAPATLPASSDAQSAFATGDISKPVFDDTGQALASILELQKEMKLHRDPKSMVSVVAKAAEQISKAVGVAVCLVQHDTVLSQSKRGTVIKDLLGESGLLASCARSGAISQIVDRLNDARLGPESSREGIKSVIISPLTLRKELSAAIAFCFKEERSLQSADIFTLQIISDALSTALRDEGLESILETNPDIDRRIA